MIRHPSVLARLAGRGVVAIAVGGWMRATMDRSRRATIPEAIMTAILSMALVLGACGLADVKDPVGSWQLSYKIGDQIRTSSLMVKEEGNGFIGTTSWQDQQGEKLEDRKFKDGKLMFAAVRKLMDNEIPIDYILTIKGGELKGTGEAEFGGAKREFDIQGKREKKDKESRSLEGSEADGQGEPRYRPCIAPRSEVAGARFDRGERAIPAADSCRWGGGKP